LTTWKLTLEYDGTKYHGWQEQANAPRTVQGALREAAEDFYEAECDIQGSGRTDAGVHALGQVAHLKTRSGREVAPEDLIRELNRRLPSDIAVVEAVRAPDGFHARHDALARAYVYQISTRKTALAKRFVWWVKEPLDVAVMQEAARKIAGRHDFSCFAANDPSKPGESTIVVVASAEVEQEDHLILFRIEASHFLWKMVRRLVGTLVKLGKGEITPADWEQLLEGKCEARLDVAAWTAPGSGLLLEGVRYPDTEIVEARKNPARWVEKTPPERPGGLEKPRRGGRQEPARRPRGAPEEAPRGPSFRPPLRKPPAGDGEEPRGERPPFHQRFGQPPGGRLPRDEGERRPFRKPSGVKFGKAGKKFEKGPPRRDGERRPPRPPFGGKPAGKPPRRAGEESGGRPPFRKPFGKPSGGKPKPRGGRPGKGPRGPRR
jgi:tRNA pseudouridine38-40 synthase